MSQFPIYTIGYGAREIEQLIALLKTHRINYLIDVRSQPYSRYKPGFSKKALTRHLAEAGIRYVFMGDALGGRPEDPACYTNGTVDYDKVAQQDFYRAGIERLRNAHRQGLRVVLLCSEGKPEQCHRSRLIGHTLTAADIPVGHIDEAGQLLDQDAVMQRRYGNQPGLFGGGGSGETAVAAPSSPPSPPPPPPEFDDFYFADDGSYPEEEAWFEDADLPPEAFDPPADAYPDLPHLPPHAGPLNLESARRLLRHIFGYDSFRSLQAEIITSVLQKQDALAVMPTGSGKSLCYQLPALLFPGLTVVASPLISLMEDQVMQLRELGIPAVYLNSSLSLPEYRWTRSQILAGKVKLLYAAPETLVRAPTLTMLAQVQVDCLTIDEAHCISEWGHDFRPEYRQLVEVRRHLEDAVCLAVTATATERVRGDIKRSLAIPAAQEFIASFNRENLHLAVAAKTDLLGQTLAFLEEHQEESGIIYCTTRRTVDELSAQLQAAGWQALPYHAGLADEVRRRHQHQFTRDDVPIIVATIAFGMGINKSNVRFILHVDLPKNLESYYQQIGRAGRDGLRADCLLLYSYGDVQTINYFISRQEPSQQVGARVRLEAMLGFVESSACRRRPLLAYFNETYEMDNCEMCDNCTTTQTDLADLTIPAQKFLSCVKRTGEIFGVNHIIDVLRGSQSQKVLSRGHDRLSTYNIGNEFSKKEWKYLARQFIQQGLLQQDMKYGSLSLTPAAYAVFRGEAVMGTLPEQPRRQTAVSATPAHDLELFARLRAKRKELADAANLPPYTVFSDRSLVEMAAYFPHSRQSFAQIYGVGEAKLEKYADVFLPIIVDYCAEKGLREKEKTAVAPTPTLTTTGRKSRTEEVVELYNQGQTIPQIAAHFGVKQNTVVGHLWKGVQAGHTLRADSVAALSTLPPEVQERVLAAFAAHGVQFLRPVYDVLQGRVDYDELHLLRLHYAVQNQK